MAPWSGIKSFPMALPAAFLLAFLLLAFQVLFVLSFEIVDNTKASTKVTAEKPTETPSLSNQSDKLARKVGDNGSQCSWPQGAITTAGKETNAQTLQGVGTGIAQVQSGRLTPPSSKCATISDPNSVFAFNEVDDDPATEKGGKKANTSGGDAIANGSGATIWIKINHKGTPNENEEKLKWKLTRKLSEKSKDKVAVGNLKKTPTQMVIEVGKAKGKIEKANDKMGFKKVKAAQAAEYIKKPIDTVEAKKSPGLSNNDIPSKVDKANGNIVNGKEDNAKSQATGNTEASKAKGEGYASKLNSVKHQPSLRVAGATIISGCRGPPLSSIHSARVIVGPCCVLLSVELTTKGGREGGENVVALCSMRMVHGCLAGGACLRVVGSCLLDFHLPADLGLTGVGSKRPLTVAGAFGAPMGNT